MRSENQTKYTDRLNQNKNELKFLYYQVYENNTYYKVTTRFKKLLETMNTYHEQRNDTLKRADADNPHWFKKNNIIGTTLYVDLFSDNITQFHEYIPYFLELGITFIHFMPILEGRPGENDGGYAVKDYKNIDPKFGTNEEFSDLILALKENNIHSCIDFVINHTAKEHEFAKKAYQGNQKYMDMYYMYDSDDIPKAFDKTVPEVFPKVSPGNFTYYPEINKWIFTSFYEFQWDLNYGNPLVFEKIVDILLYLANIGIDMIRLDAIPFIWKALETSCRNHPTIHSILRMLHLIVEIVCPSVAILGEAIVEPEEIIKYFGVSSAECDLMYNATQMVNLWNAIATRDTRLLQIDTNRLLPLGGGCWINYARCHDDIGWGFNEDATRQMGFDPYAHKQFLINFYKGNYNDSFSIGDLYEFNPEDLDARNCGTMASLCGLEKALNENDLYQKELALKRIQLLHGVLLASSGIPLIYSGDEIATLNNYDYLSNSHKAHDSRWLHRGHFDHDKSERRHRKGTTQGIIFTSLKNLITIRKENSIFTPTIPQKVVNVNNNHIYCFFKKDGDQTLLALFNFSEDRQFISTDALHNVAIFERKTDLISGKQIDTNNQQLLIGPYEFLWLL